MQLSNGKNSCSTLTRVDILQGTLLRRVLLAIFALLLQLELLTAALPPLTPLFTLA